MVLVFPIQVLTGYPNSILRWHPHRMHIRHALRETEFHGEFAFMNGGLFRQSQRVHFTVNVVIGDEAGFMMDGEVNSHNI